jgi:hypothetical protein
MYKTTRQNETLFFDTSRRAIGRQSLENCIGNVFKTVKVDWANPEVSKATLRRQLKSAFFPYFTAQETAAWTAH